MTCSLDFVDSIASSPTVRLALANGPKWIIHPDETDFPPPPLRRAIAQTLLTDGAVIPSAAYDLRRITLGLFLETGTADETAMAVQALHRELDRPGGNILRWWEHTTEPVFFRTFRASASAVRRHGFSDGKRKQISVDILAEPFAYGLLETPVSGVSLDTNPANSNGNFVDASSIKGDVETPALIRWPASGGVVANRETLFAVRRRGDPSATPFLFQAENQTNGTDTTDQANASFSGAGGGTRTTFATSTMQTRSTISDLGTASVDLRGRYRVYARYAKTVSGDTVTVQIQWGTSGGTVTTNDTVTLPSGTTISMVDLGEIQIPRGEDPGVNFADGTELAVSDTYHLAFRAARTGSGNLDLDYFILVPADDRTTIAKWVEAGPDRWWIGSNRFGNLAAEARSSSDQAATAAPPGLTGKALMLTPNQTNRVFIVYEIGSGLATTLTTIAVTVSYLPRYLSVRPASS